MRFFLFLLMLGLLFISGCYTKFASLEQVMPIEETQTIIDSLGDTVKVIHRIDTVISKEKETCVWERDFMGRPYLRCYDSYYPRDWFIYNNAPWWYRNDPFWYDYDLCPRYYRYDPSCGCCRYYRSFTPKNRGWIRDGNPSRYPHRKQPPSDNVPDNGNSPSSNSSVVPTESQPTRTNARKVPLPAPQPIENKGISKETADTTKHVADTTTQILIDSTAPASVGDTVKIKKRNLRSLRSR